MNLLDKTTKELNEKYKRPAVMSLQELLDIPTQRHSTGFLSIDNILGGGMPEGRIMEIYGPPSNGKTTLALQIAAQYQKQNPRKVLYIDTEQAFDPPYAAALGVNTETLMLNQPESGEEGVDILLRLVETGEIGLAVVDSVASLVPTSELESEIQDQSMGVQAKLISRAVKRLLAVGNRTKTIAIFINQIRFKLGVVFGNPETTTGGFALPYWSSIRLDMRRGEPIKLGKEITGAKVKFKTVKNKLASPFQTTELDLTFGHGFCGHSDLATYAKTKGIIEQRGAWYFYKGEQLAQGFDGVIKTLKENLDLHKEIWDNCTKSKGS